jgi:hypothetical protein
MKKRTIPIQVRVDSGPVQFGDDWPGVFVRGDDAMYFANALEHPEEYATDAIKELIELLRSCHVGTGQQS